MIKFCVLLKTKIDFAPNNNQKSTQKGWICNSQPKFNYKSLQKNFDNQMSNLDFINKKRKKKCRKKKSNDFFGTHRILTSWSLPASCGVRATLRIRIVGRIRRILISIERAIIFIVKRLIIASAIVRKTIEIIIIIYKNMNKVKSYNNISIIGAAFFYLIFFCLNCQCSWKVRSFLIRSFSNFNFLTHIPLLHRQFHLN